MFPAGHLARLPAALDINHEPLTTKRPTLFRRRPPFPSRLRGRLRAPVRAPDKLAHGEELFALEYLANMGNGAAAYRASHPNCRSHNAAAAAASRLLRNVKVQAFLEREQAARFKRLRMDADEALYLVSCDARADIRDLFDEHDELLPARYWPDSVASSVKAFRRGPFGTRVVLNDSLAARRIILEQTGKLNGTRDRAAGDLARILAGDFEQGE